MNGRARVTSIDAIREFKAALAIFEEEARSALSAIEMELRRANYLVRQELPSYWQNEIKKNRAELSQSRSDLSRKRISSQGEGGPGLSEPKENVREALRRMREAEAKVEVVRKWGFAVERAMQEYHGKSLPLSDTLVGDLQRALGKLEMIIRTLNEYVAIAPPTTPRDLVSPARQAPPSMTSGQSPEVEAKVDASLEDPAANSSSETDEDHHGESRGDGNGNGGDNVPVILDPPVPSEEPAP